MTGIISSNIISPLGNTTSENFDAVLEGRSGLRSVGDYTLSLFREREKIEGYTFFESLAIRSACAALEGLDIDRKKAILILSTTKGNIEMLENDDAEMEDELPHSAARKIARYLGIPGEPIVVCNACISGIAALILAMRLEKEYAVVIGCDVLGRFFISGFNSLKALDRERCRPFDSTRGGLNLGEAAATLVLGKNMGKWKLTAGAIRNDANHISGPSRTGEGSFLALEAAAADYIAEGRVTVVGVHGTATVYNDEMESIALHRAGMDSIPVMAVKSYFGHTMGAAGILETILGIEAQERGIVPGTQGFSSMGVTYPVGVSSETRKIERGTLVKILSGFGGCNAAICLSDDECSSSEAFDIAVRHGDNILITPSGAWKNGKRIETLNTGSELVTELYHMGEDYPKFYKMDPLSQLAYVASSLLISDSVTDRAIVLFNRSSSLVSDLRHEKASREGFASPSVFVYTLPNIMTGELAIRYGYRTETSLYILDGKDSPLRETIINATFRGDREIGSILTGWIDMRSENDFIAELEILWKN